MENLLHPGSNSLGRGLEYNDTIDKEKWKVPSYLRELPCEVKGDIMYRVHAILENIEISRDEQGIIVSEYARYIEIPAFRNYMSDQIALKRNRNELH